VSSVALLKRMLSIMQIFAVSQSSVALLKRMLSIMQIFAVSQLGCSNGAFEKNSLKKQSTNHWG